MSKLPNIPKFVPDLNTRKSMSTHTSQTMIINHISEMKGGNLRRRYTKKDCIILCSPYFTVFGGMFSLPSLKRRDNFTLM